MTYSRGEDAINSFRASLADFRSSADLIQRTSPLASTLKMSNGGSMKEDSGKLAREPRAPQLAERPGSVLAAAVLALETISVARASGSGRLQSLCGNSIGFWVAAEAASLNPFHVTSCHHEVAYATPSRAEDCARDRGICFFIARLRRP